MAKTHLDINEIELIKSVSDAEAENRLAQIFDILLSDEWGNSKNQVEQKKQISYNHARRTTCK